LNDKGLWRAQGYQGRLQAGAKDSVLGDAIQAARANRAVRAQENKENHTDAETVSDPKPSLASLLLAERQE
jgi:hypothetical protein